MPSSQESESNPRDLELKIMKNIKCELCDCRANAYCESDEASLCWSCDSNVHSANFIVEKHSRILLCQICQSPTPWTATGPKLGPTLSLCQFCVVPQNVASLQFHHQDHLHSGSSTTRDFDHRHHHSGDDEENQVVPLSPPPPVSS
ncbi:B-box zinc finger protein 32-like [Cucumis melo var. makuwa]|uniref:B-box zinc finger protein 32-like n=2 Tax=Cucumis melo TaxID=3656 RepID=A0A5A7UTR2_CUCMM|nr:B-box zinc finger protein 32-like [Cucumis melo var. makuwa]TYK26363.1 B-box zinc finger protein 32-like [Cucumis melo var. makuwa]